MKRLRQILAGLLPFITWTGMSPTGWARDTEPNTAQVTVHAPQAGCKVDLDAQSLGASNAQGDLVLERVAPGDHYLHVQCPGVPEMGYFLSPRAGEKLALSKAQEISSQPLLAKGPSEVAQTKMQLQQLIQEAVHLRNQGRLDEAAEKVRQALKLDPENSDLHRELGITFLLGKDWERARVEMIEAIHHEPTDADAHNGLGYALEKLGNLPTALKEYRLATQLEPDDPNYRTHYFDILSKLAVEKTKKK